MKLGKILKKRVLSFNHDKKDKAILINSNPLRDPEYLRTLSLEELKFSSLFLNSPHLNQIIKDKEKKYFQKE